MSWVQLQEARGDERLPCPVCGGADGCWPPGVDVWVGDELHDGCPLAGAQVEAARFMVEFEAPGMIPA